jgi:hypothetical protein
VGVSGGGSPGGGGGVGGGGVAGGRVGGRKWGMAATESEWRWDGLIHVERPCLVVLCTLCSQSCTCRWHSHWSLPSAWPIASPPHPHPPPLSLSTLTLTHTRTLTHTPHAPGMSIGKLIRNAETSKTPVMCVVGPREAESGSLSVRTYAEGEVGEMGADEVLARILAANVARSGF